MTDVAKEWWREVAEWLAKAPVTRDDERALFAVMRLAGAEEPSRLEGIAAITTPEAHALTYFRQYFLAPHGDFEVGEPWWQDETPEDARFWAAFEEAAVARRPESADEIRRQLRSGGGQAVALDCRRMWPPLAGSPKALAHATLKRRFLG